MGCQHVENLATANASRQPLCIGCKWLESAVPAGREFSLDDASNFGCFLRKFCLIVCKEFCPSRLSLFASFPQRVLKVRFDRFRNEKLFVFWPAIRPLRQLDLFIAQRCAVCIVRICFVRRTEADNRSDDDQRRLVGGRFECIKGFLQSH